MNAAALTTAILLTLGSNALAHETKATGTLIDLSAEASRSATNDLFRATVFTEASDSNPANLARQVNQTIAQGLTLAKAYPDIKIKTGSSYTTPIYGKTQRNIESWRMRSDLQLESKSPAAFTELLGKLQSTLSVSNLSTLPAPETSKKIEADTTLDAITQFKERASLIAGAMGKKYKITEMNIGNTARPAQYAMRSKAAFAAADTPMPMEAGESQITVTISGKIELSE